MKHQWVANGCRCHVVCMNCDAIAHNDSQSKIDVGPCKPSNDDVFEKHRKRIAEQTERMPDAMRGVM